MSRSRRTTAYNELQQPIDHTVYLWGGGSIWWCYDSATTWHSKVKRRERPFYGDSRRLTQCVYDIKEQNDYDYFNITHKGDDEFDGNGDYWKSTRRRCVMIDDMRLRPNYRRGRRRQMNNESRSQEAEGFMMPWGMRLHLLQRTWRTKMRSGRRLVVLWANHMRPSSEMALSTYSGQYGMTSHILMQRH